MYANHEMNDYNFNFKDHVNDSTAHDDSMLNNMDKKRRKAVFRRTVDYNSPVGLFIEQRSWKRKYSNRCIIQPDTMYQHLLTPPVDYNDNPMNSVCAKHVRTSTNKNKCPIYTMCWTPDGRRLITGASSGEFTLWNGLTFNFETILQAHDTQIRTMKWSNNEEWLVSGDESGFVKYWQTNMSDINVFQAHKDSVRDLSFCPSDRKFATCSVDSTVRIWDFETYKEERVLRGHGCDVMCVAWHPTKCLLFSGSKDSQHPVKLWDPKSGEFISTMHVHKSGCTDIKINKNGNWFLTASRDHTIKLFDMRNLKNELQMFRGHKKDVNNVAWHPYHETLFASGSGDGALLYWLVGTDMEVGSVEGAHDNIIWCLDWHPMGHILASGSNDFSTKFWTRNQPGDVLNENLHEENPTNPKTDISFNIDTDFELLMDHKDFIKHSEVDINNLSSTIAADIYKSEPIDIPGLVQGMNNDQSNSFYEEELVNKEVQSKEIVNRVIPKQFADNWNSKASVPVVYKPEVICPQQIPPPMPIIPMEQVMSQILLQSKMIPQLTPQTQVTPQVPVPAHVIPPVQVKPQVLNPVPIQSQAAPQLQAQLPSYIPLDRPSNMNFHEEKQQPPQNFRRNNFPHNQQRPPNGYPMGGNFDPRFHHNNYPNNNLRQPFNGFNPDRYGPRPIRPDFHPQNDFNRNNGYHKQFPNMPNKKPRYGSHQNRY